MVDEAGGRSVFYRVNGRFNPLADEMVLEDEPATFYGGYCSSEQDSKYTDDAGYNTPDVGYLQPRVALGDGADVPLLNGIDVGGCSDGVGNVVGNGGNSGSSGGTDYCKEPVPVTNSSAWKKLLAATTMCLLFMVVELVGGYIAGSLAVMTDAAHLLSDCVGFLVSLFAVWVAGQPPTKRFTYGYHRAEVLGALLSISVIWILTGIFVYLAVTRLVRSDFDIHADAMLIVSAIGIGINIVMGCILHGGTVGRHSHSHEQQNINVRAAIIHVLGDLIQSMGVFVSACVIKFYPDLKMVDPVCTFVCCLLVIASTAGVLRQSVWVLLETVPPHIDTCVLQAALASLDGVDSVHSLHVWALTPGQYVATAHISVGGLTDRDVVLERAQRLLYTKFHLERITIQVERHPAELVAQ